MKIDGDVANYWIRWEKEMGKEVAKYIISLRKSPPRLLGHLKGGVDTERMMRIKEEIEARGGQQ
jgi:hypothetical protein